MHDLSMAFDFSNEIALVDGKKILFKESPEKLSSCPLINEIFGVNVKFSAEKNRFFYTIRPLKTRGTLRVFTFYLRKI